MNAVFTSLDLRDIPPGGELILAPDTLVTPLALEDAARRGITLRMAAAQSGTHDGREANAHAARWIVATRADSVADAGGDGGFIRAVTEEVISYLSDPSCLRLSAEPGEPPREPSDSSTQICATHAPLAMDVVAALIDHTLLKPDASRSDIEQACREAVHFGFATVCVNPWYVPLAAQLLRGLAVKVCTVVGFPLGATLPQIKMLEAEEAIKLGAQEIDAVQNVGALKSAQDEQVEADLRAIVEISHRAGAICKVILETSLLSREEKIRAALLAKRVGADFVKTSTGFASGGGATAEDVALLRKTVGAEMGIKASGGIRTLGDLQAMVSAGATRIGTSSGVKILEEARGWARIQAPAPGSPSEDALGE